MNYLTKFLNMTKKVVRKIQSRKLASKENLVTSNSIEDPSNKKVYSRSEDMSLSRLEEVYYNVVLKQNFYDQNYGLEWHIAPYEKLAEVINNTFSPKYHVDIGCGIGLLVKSMRNLGANSYGIDFSEALINKADASIKKHLAAATAEDWIQKASLKQVDLITFTEVFEHLPVSILENILNQLYQNYTGKLFLTIPSFGFDSTFKSGIPVNDDNPTWQRDMMENIPFKNIVLENGLPHHGHITLASYRWWTEFFLFHGWARNRDLEEYCFENFHDTLKLYGWNSYILEKMIIKDELNRGIKTGKSLSFGWHKYHRQDDFNGRWSDGLAKIYLFEPNLKVSTLRLTLSAPEINYTQDWNLLVTLENLTRAGEYKFKWNTHCCSSWQEIHPRAKQVTIDINFSQKPPDPIAGEVASHCWRITIISPSFCPTEYGNSPDARRLGIVVHSLELL